MPKSFDQLNFEFPLFENTLTDSISKDTNIFENLNHNDFPPNPSGGPPKRIFDSDFIPRSNAKPNLEFIDPPDLNDFNKILNENLITPPADLNFSDLEMSPLSQFPEPESFFNTEPQLDMFMPDNIGTDVDKMINDLDLFTIETDKTFFPDGQDANQNDISSKEIDFDDEAQLQETKFEKASSIASAVIFYTAVFLLIFSLLLYGTNQHNAKFFFGFSCFNVTTTSMQSKFSQGSLVIAKEIDPAKIQIGDNVSYFSETEMTVITHQVIDIIEDYEHGLPGFRTKGIENPDPDFRLISSNQIIGKVRFSIPLLGNAVDFIRKNPWIIPVLLILLLTISLLLHTFSDKDESFLPFKKFKNLFKKQHS